LARRRTTQVQIGAPAFDFLRRVLLLQPQPYAADQKQEWLRFIMRWQQFAGPVMAKGLEDTAFYVHNSLISRNEVGGDALREKPPLRLEEFHQFNTRRLAHWPYSLNATSTHDTKRSEDVRARIDVLSEFAAEWEKRLGRWIRWNAGKKSIVDGIAVPTPDEEVLLYQTLLGVWPLEAGELEDFPERMKCFALKAVREAKIYTGWIRHHEPHEAAVLRFVDAILRDSETGRFRRDFLSFQEKIAFHGALNSLSQVLIKITAPGVPDLYQGTEQWNLSLVDPDNRRSVDFRKQAAMLEEIRRQETGRRSALLRDLITFWKDGRIKLYITDKALDFRRAHAEGFLDGDYIPLEASGTKRANICAFGRCRGKFWSLTVVPRWTTQLVSSRRAPLGEGVWQDTALILPESAPESWRNVLTGEDLKTSLCGDGGKVLYLHRILRRFPVALLTETGVSDALN
jgi:(1->4)-alpha-D-glucan 1-alpha-D-glucosylmutase